MATLVPDEETMFRESIHHPASEGLQGLFAHVFMGPAKPLPQGPGPQLPDKTEH